MKSPARITMLLMAALFLSGCGSVISKGALMSVDRNITVDRVQKEPERYIETKVLWGGVIISTQNMEKTTDIEVLETDLDFNDLPEFDYSSSRGRFIIRAHRYLDPTVYKEGKGVTVAGKVEGISVRKIGKMDYAYPIVRPIEIKLSEELPKDFYAGYPMWGYPYYDPYSAYGPYNSYYPFSPFGPTYPYGPYPFRRHPFYPYP
ncbi:MAG: hypothetical protein BMS9Abin24_063 [Thermodesulfobacteriota bacterium]|nr:MAG: hypothetical protein BMS9Abin24_063 [Thermodesulfobacteriota bacterium]